jgi:pimeloyl-ACP methyl ester carboxylesterase
MLARRYAAGVESVRAEDGARIAYSEAGDGPALVLVHGITESRRAWDPIVPALTDRWRVVSLDLRGHGDSDRRDPYDPITLANDVATVVAATGVEDPLMVGHSLGGIVVSAYGGAGHPARAIVNVDQPIALGGFKESLAPIEPMLRGTPEEFATAIGLVFNVLDGPLPSAERARLDELSSPEQDVVLGIWGTVFEASAEDLDLLTAAVVGGVSVPYLSLHGTDPGDDYPDWLTAVIPTATIEIWDGLGHYPQLTAPERFLTRLEQFDPATSPG